MDIINSGMTIDCLEGPYLTKSVPSGQSSSTRITIEKLGNKADARDRLLNTGIRISGTLWVCF